MGQKKFNFDVSSSSTDLPPALVNYVKNGGIQIVRFESLEDCVNHIKNMYCCEEMRRQVEKEKAEQYSKNDDSSYGSKSNNSKEGSIPIIGIEIDPASVTLEQQPFRTSTAFMMGNEGQGMTSKQMAICDGFVRIEQYGGGTASLNVSVSVGVVLQRFFEKRLMHIK